MAHTCPTCSEPCYCMGDYEEVLTGQPAYCRHCTDIEPKEKKHPLLDNEDDNGYWPTLEDGSLDTEKYLTSRPPPTEEDYLKYRYPEDDE